MFLKNAHYKRLQPKILTLLKMELRRACDVNGGWFRQLCDKRQQWIGGWFDLEQGNGLLLKVT